MSTFSKRYELCPFCHVPRYVTDNQTVRCHECGFEISVEAETMLGQAGLADKVRSEMKRRRFEIKDITWPISECCKWPVISTEQRGYMCTRCDKYEVLVIQPQKTR